MLTVEDGTGLSNADSYVSVATADAYFTARGNKSWSEKSFATGSFTLRVQPTAGDLFEVSEHEYTFRATLSNPGDVKIGANLAETIANFVAAINWDVSKAGTSFQATTAVNKYVRATVSENTVNFSATTLGEFGNSVVLIWTGSSLNEVTTMSGGLPDKEVALRKAAQFMEARYSYRWQGSKLKDNQKLSWPRDDAEDLDANEIIGVPQQVKDAQCELALIALTEELFVNATEGVVSSESISIGPISTSESYIGGKAPSRVFSGIDSILRLVFASGGGVERG
jgi:hypothetical protein